MINGDELRGRFAVFDPVAERYAAVRPGYPDALIDEVLRFAQVSAGDCVVEVAAGTGKATELLARKGLHVVAVEPGAGMVAQARRATAQWPLVEVVQASLETWNGQPEKVGLVTCAQAWHWLDPTTRTEAVHRLLRKRGTLAVWYNRHGLADAGLRRAINRAYRQLTPTLERLRSRPLRPRAGDELARSIVEDGHFGNLVVRGYPWSETYTAEQYVDLIGTFSDHLVLSDGALPRLLDAVSAAIDAACGTLTLDYLAGLYLARARG